MKPYTENILPDSLTGAIFALEGIRDACVILNGPTGCKFYHSAISDEQFVRSLSFDPLFFSEQFYFGQPRVPCTYLDGHDYVYGSGEKLSAILESAQEKGYGLVVVVNSPGAALIGDDLNLALQKAIQDTPCFSIENSGYSGTFGEGVQNALVQVFEKLEMPPEKTVPKSVNLLGMCIQQKYYDNNVAEIRRLLGLCGIIVVSAPGAQEPLEKLRSAVQAAVNIVVYPEYGLKLAEYLKTLHGTDYLVPQEGPPIGFDATEAFLKQICLYLDADPQPALAEIEKARARSYLFLSRYASLLGLPKGALFSVKAESSVSYALVKWLTEYLGMIPAAVEGLDDTDPVFEARLRELLAGIGCEASLENPVNSTETQIVFADGSTIAQLKLNDCACCGMEIALPSLGYLDITEKALFGEKGALLILENIMNGLRYVR